MGKAILILPSVLCFAASACAGTPEGSPAVSADGMLTFGRYEQDNHPDSGPEQGNSE